MKRPLSLLITLSACAVVSCSTNSNTESGGATHFRDLLPGQKIVYSANLDGEIEPCGCRSNPTGGINRRYNLLQEKAVGEKLVIDSGDLFYQSTPVPPFLEKQWNYQASVLAKAYREFGVEVFEPGELDLADGLEQFNKLAAQAGFKVVSANLYLKSTTKRLYDPYVILTKGTKKVAIFGLYDESLPLPPEVEAHDHLAEAHLMVEELRGKADVLIALTHEGLDKDTELAHAEPKIDAIFGAHTQSFLLDPMLVGDTLIFQPSFRGQHVGVFADTLSKMYQVDERFDSAPGKENKLDVLLAKAKTDIARINKETEAELMGGAAEPKLTVDGDATTPNAASIKAAHSKVTGFQTFAQCAQCHAAQYAFHRNTPHMHAFETLVKAKQSANLDCLQCHTVGMQQPGGWKNVNKLVLNKAGKAIDAENFAKSLPQMNAKALNKVSKVFFNVQCETCHGAGGDHPTGSLSAISKTVSTNTCLQCHTTERAPGWYKNGEPDNEIIQIKLKSMTCPGKF